MASELETLSAIEQHGDLNPIQKTRLSQLRAAGSSGNPTGVASTGFLTPSSSTPSLSSPTDFFTQQKQAQDKLLADQQAREQGFLTRFTGAIGGLEKPEDIYKRLSTTLGIDPLRQAAMNLEQTLSALPQTMLERAQRFGLSEGQRRELLASETGKLAPQVSTAETALGARQGQLGELLSSTLAGQEKQLLPFQTEAGFISDASARATSMFSHQNEQEFSVLLNKIKNDEQLTRDEAQRAADLAKQNQEYQLELTKLKQPFNVSRGASVYDPTSGKFITAPSSQPGGINPDIEGGTGTPSGDLGDWG